MSSKDLSRTYALGCALIAVDSGGDPIVFNSVTDATGDGSQADSVIDPGGATASTQDAGGIPAPAGDATASRTAPGGSALITAGGGDRSAPTHVDDAEHDAPGISGGVVDGMDTSGFGDTGNNAVLQGSIASGHGSGFYNQAVSAGYGDTSQDLTHTQAAGDGVNNPPPASAQAMAEPASTDGHFPPPPIHKPAPDEDASDPIVIFTTGQSNFTTTNPFAWTPPSNLLIWNSFNSPNLGTAFVNASAPCNDGTIFANVSNVPVLFAADLAEQTQRPVYLINISYQGQAIDQWLPGAVFPDMYDATRSNVPTALAQIPGKQTIDLFMWWQGEGNAGQTDFYNNLTTVISSFETESWFGLNTPELFFGLNSEENHLDPAPAG